MNRNTVVGLAIATTVAGLLGAVTLLDGSASQGKSEEEVRSLPGFAEKAKKPRQTSDGAGKGADALSKAAQANKYAFLFFWKTESEETERMEAVFESAMKKIADRAFAARINVGESEEASVVDRFDLSRAPMPLVLVIAPNGAIMGGFPQKFSKEDLTNAFGSPCTEQTMKTLQDGNLVLLCVQNKSTKANDEAMKGVRDFASDPRYSAATKIVTLDPSDTAELNFLSDLKIDPLTTEAVTAFLAPPGSVIAEFKGATSKDELISVLQKASTACGAGGCGPGGCGPKK